jgi:hypothetical protein
MGLQNLVAISLVQITPAPDMIKRLLAAAARHTGDLIPESAVAECLSQAESAQSVARNWLTANKRHLLESK